MIKRRYYKTYKYYNITIRSNEEISQYTLEGIRNLIWDYVGSIAKKDIVILKVNKPRGEFNINGGKNG